MPNLKESFVYLFCDPAQELYKIGVTKNLYSKRMKQLQTGNGTELHLVTYYKTYHPYRIESFLHKKYHEKREHGEWFKLDKEEVFNFKKTCQHYEEIIESIKTNPYFKNFLRILLIFFFF